MTRPDHPIECVPESVPSASFSPPRAPASRVRPTSPISSMGDALSEPAPVRPRPTNPVRPQDQRWGHGRWLITERTLPAWTEVYELLADHRWHPTEDVAELMHQAGHLAPRTITNLLRSASARKWIRQRRGRIQMRTDFAHELHLPEGDGCAQ